MILNTRGLTRHFGGLKAVDQVDFDLETKMWPMVAGALGGTPLDVAMPKPRGEVLVVGEAAAPGGLLSLDLPSIVWKQMTGVELDDDDLRETDYSCWSTLQFRDQDGQVTAIAEMKIFLHCVLSRSGDASVTNVICRCVP